LTGFPSLKEMVEREIARRTDGEDLKPAGVKSRFASAGIASREVWVPYGGGPLLAPLHAYALLTASGTCVSISPGPLFGTRNGPVGPAECVGRTGCGAGQGAPAPLPMSPSLSIAVQSS
jgi:hypothetical protein